MFELIDNCNIFELYKLYNLKLRKKKWNTENYDLIKIASLNNFQKKISTVEGKNKYNKYKKDLNRINTIKKINNDLLNNNNLSIKQIEKLNKRLIKLNIKIDNEK